MEHLGITPRGESLEFPIFDQDVITAKSLLADYPLSSGGYVCIYSGASVPARRWPAEQFAAVGDALAVRGLSIILTGTAGEAALTGAIAKASRAHSRSSGSDIARVSGRPDRRGAVARLQ